MGVSENGGTPESSHFNRVFHYKPFILGNPYFGNTHIREFGVKPSFRVTNPLRSLRSPG